MITPLHIVFMAATLAIISVIGVCSGRKIKSVSDFSVGGKQAGPMLVAATILGTLVGGAATIGTAQLAFKYGFSAWWFTLAGGIACLVLGLILAKPLHNSNCETIPQLLVETYGGRVGITASVFLSIGTFLLHQSLPLSHPQEQLFMFSSSYSQLLSGFSGYLPVESAGAIITLSGSLGLSLNGSV